MTDTARLRELLDEVDRLREALSGLIDKYQCIVEFGDLEGRSMTDEALVKAITVLRSGGKAMNREALIALRDAVKAGTGSRGQIEDVAIFCFQDVLIGMRASGAWSGSLDAAKALHEAVLPGWAWTIESAQAADVWPPGRLTASLRVFSDEGNPARAWLLVILEALIAEAGE